MPRKKTHQEFIEEVNNKFGDKYSILSEYEGKDSKIRVKHNSCGYEYETTPSNLIKNRKCRNCESHLLWQSKRADFTSIKQFVEDAGYIMLSKSSDYTNQNSKLQVQCPVGHEYSVAFNNFYQGRRCPYCSGMKTKTYEEMKEIIKNEGYELLSTEYISNSSPIILKCDKGHTYDTVYTSFQQGHRCSECANLNKGATLRHNIEYAKKIFTENGCILLEEKYINAKTKMKFLCECGQIGYLSLLDLQRGYRCNNCKMDRIKSKLKLSYEQVYGIFEQYGCTLLESEYINNRVKMRYRCKCGSESKIKLNHFLVTTHCANCTPNESQGVIKIKQILGLKEVQYLKEYTFDDLKDSRALRFDFAIFKNNELHSLIEFDGIQHFEFREGFMTYEEYELLQEHDSIKNNYCKNNGIKLLRIPYTEINNIDNILQEHLS